MLKRALKRPLAGRLRQFWGAIPLTIILLLIEFFDELHYAVESATLPALRDDLALSYAEIGLLLGLPYVLSTLIEPAIMLLGDTGLRKRLVMAGGLTITIALLMIASAGSFPVVLLAMMLAYPASGAFVSLSQATLMDLNRGREAQLMARWTVAGSLGNLLGPLFVAGGFVLALGWRWAFAGLAILALLLVLAVALQSFSPTPPGTPVSRPSSAPANPTRSNGPPPHEMLRNLQDAVRNPRLLRWVVLLEFSDLLLDIFTGYMTLYFTDVAGFTPAQASLTLTVLMFASLAADLALIPLLERIPGRTLIRASALAAIAVYTAWLLVPWPAAKIALLVAIRFSTLGWYPVLQGEAYATLPERSGTVAAVGSLGGLLGGGLVWLVGWVAGQAGLSNAMWLLLLGPLSLALFVPKAGD